MTRFTPDQFLKFGEKCAKCDELARWLPSIKDLQCYCDEHFPYHYEQLFEIREAEEPPKSAD